MVLLCRWTLGCSRLAGQAAQLLMLRQQRQLQLLETQQAPCKRPPLLQSERQWEQVAMPFNSLLCIAIDTIHDKSSSHRSTWSSTWIYCLSNISRKEYSAPDISLLDCDVTHAGQPHRSLVFASHRGRAEVLPGAGTSYAPELSMSRPDVASTSLSPAFEAVDAAQPFETMQQGAAEPVISVRLEQVIRIML